MKKILAVPLLLAAVLCMQSCKTQTILIDATEGDNSASVVSDTTARDETSVSAEEPVSVAQSEQTTAEKPTENATAPTTEVDLSITLPEKNGTMKVETDASNKYIQTVIKDRHLRPELLVAVYSVPETDQNYVFEFTSSDFTADNLNRVFLLDNECRITGVAAVKSNERENMSSTENWFCMNVLIKGVIFPEIEEMF